MCRSMCMEENKYKYQLISLNRSTNKSNIKLSIQKWELNEFNTEMVFPLERAVDCVCVCVCDVFCCYFTSIVYNVL